MVGRVVLNEYRPNYVTHPGVTLAEALEERGMSQADLAQRIGLSKKVISEIIKGKVPITTQSALLLETVLGIPARFWNNRQMQYDEACERIERRNQLKRYFLWLRLMPYREMVKWGWVSEGDDEIDKLREILSFFGVATPAQWTDKWKSATVAFRKSASYAPDPYALAAWLRKGELDAQKIQCQPFERGKFCRALTDVRSLTSEPPDVFVSKLVKLCAEAGVAVVFIRQLTKTCANGVARWLSPTKALIQLSLRGRSNDVLWFTFFHEAGHIVRHGKRQIFIDVGLGGQAPEEQQADRFAGDLLIPPSAYEAFVASGRFSRNDVLRFASDVGIAAGIVVGRLQHDEHISWASVLNRLKMRLRWV